MNCCRKDLNTFNIAMYMQWNVQSSLEAVTNYCANPYTAKPAKR